MQLFSKSSAELQQFKHGESVTLNSHFWKSFLFNMVQIDVFAVEMEQSKFSKGGISSNHDNYGVRLLIMKLLPMSRYGQRDEDIVSKKGKCQK